MLQIFKVTHQDKHTQARIAHLKTDHGTVETPVFMPVATQAVFKGGLDSRDAYEINAPIILANGYHLYLRPGIEIIKQTGGLHKFMNWSRPMLTDSGGFQVWSLGSLKSPAQNCADVRARHREKDGLIKIDDEGVNFTSHIDGKKHRLTPEDVIRIQQDLGADIVMAFDEATPDTASYSYAKEAMGRTHQWARRCLDESARCKMQSAKPQLLFGIIQGGRFKKLRQESARFISSLAFDGIAIGGESIGFKMKRTVEILTCLQGYLNKEKPIYTMGVGFSPSDFFEVVENGVDMFDCVAPARLARHGSLYCRRVGRHYRYRLNIFNAQYQSDPQPICDWCDCAVCQTYSRSYLRHLFKSKELTALRLATIHNLRFMLKVMEEIRESIKEGVFRELKKEWF